MSAKSKADFRRDITNQREKLCETEKLNKDDKIYEGLIKSNFYKEADTLFIYVSFGKEVDTCRLIKYSLDNGKRVCVPKVISKKEGMKAVQINSMEELREGKHYGILEPVNFDKALKEDEIDLIIVPGLAFDIKGGRVGYGGGFYDRFMAYLNGSCKKIALAYEFQIFEEVSTSPLDISVNGIITEERVILI